MAKARAELGRRLRPRSSLRSAVATASFPMSPLSLPYLSAVSPLHLRYISPISPLYLLEVGGRDGGVLEDLGRIAAAAAHLVGVRARARARARGRDRVRVRVRFRLRVRLRVRIAAAAAHHEPLDAYGLLQ